MAELADARDSKSRGRKAARVRPPPPAPSESRRPTDRLAFFVELGAQEGVERARGADEQEEERDFRSAEAHRPAAKADGVTAEALRGRPPPPAPFLTYCRWRQEYGGMDVSKENDQPTRWHTGQLGGMSFFWKSVFLNKQPDNKRSDISFHKSSDEKKRHYNMNISFYG